MTTDHFPRQAVTVAGKRLAIGLLAFLGAAVQAAPPASLRVVDWMLRVPAAWSVRVPANDMRVAQFSAPSTAGNAEVAVFFFGAANGGSIEDNVRRWSASYTDAEGRPARPVIEKGSASGMPVTRVAIDGRKRAPIGSAPAPATHDALRVAILETPRGNLIFQLWGGRVAVSENEERFRGMVASLRPAP